MRSIKLQNEFPGEAVEASLYGLFKTRLDELLEGNNPKIILRGIEQMTSKVFFAPDLFYYVMW